MFHSLDSNRDELETKGVSMGRFPASRGMSETYAIQTDNGNLVSHIIPLFPDRYLPLT